MSSETTEAKTTPPLPSFETDDEGRLTLFVFAVCTRCAHHGRTVDATAFPSDSDLCYHDGEPTPCRNALEAMMSISPAGMASCEGFEPKAKTKTREVAT